MSRPFFAQTSIQDDTTPKDPKSFDDFQSLQRHIIDFKKGNTGEILLVHLSSQATQSERNEIKALGGELI